MGVFHRDVEHGNVLREQPGMREILNFFLPDFDITWGERWQGYGTVVYVFFLNPGKDMRAMFGIGSEILLLYSPFQTLQPRILQLADHILGNAPARDRVDPLTMVLVTPATDLEAVVSAITAANAQSRIIVPFRQHDCLNVRDQRLLRHRFREHLFTRDLFDVSQPITDDLYFFGRKSILVDLRDSFRSGENVGLFGLRKTGKTSVILKIERVLGQDNRGRMLYFDLQDAALYSLRWWELVEQMRSRLMGKPPDASITEVTAAAAFRESVVAWGRRNKSRRVLFALDEIEHIAPGLGMQKHWEIDFLHLWKTLRAVQAVNRHICFLVAGVNASCMETPVYAGHDNPLFSMAKIRYMPPFEKEDIEQMTHVVGRVMGLAFSDASCQYLKNIYGGHPLLTRMACSYTHKFTAAAKERPVNVDVAMLSADADARHSFLFPHGQYILGMLQAKYPQEYEMLEGIANGDVAFFQEVAREVPQYAEHLRAYGLIAGEPPELAYPFLGSYLRGRAADKQKLTKEDAHPDPSDGADLLEISGLRNRMEPKLRRYIKRVLKAHLGSDRWIDPIIAVLPDQQRKQCQGVAADTILNERLLLSNLMTVLDQNWTNYFKHLEAAVPAERISRSQLAVLLEYVNAHREDAHAKAVSEASIAGVRLAVPLLEKAIERYLDE